MMIIYYFRVYMICRLVQYVRYVDSLVGYFYLFVLLFKVKMILFFQFLILLESKDF